MTTKPITTRGDQHEVAHLTQELNRLHSEMLKLEAALADKRDQVHPAHRESARNLIHYLALRGHDIRNLQDKLAALGLSSLDRAEAQVMATVESVLTVLYHLAASPPSSFTHFETGAPSGAGKKVLEERTAALLGPKPAGRPAGRSVRIMVTMPTEAGSSYEFVRDLVSRGMDCMRVNCAHDDIEGWSGMVENLKRARAELGKPCTLLMDVPGPKVRTGPVEPGRPVIKIRPHRDDSGRVLAPAHVWLAPAEDKAPTPETADASLTLPGPWLSTIGPGDSVFFEDARGASRSMKITSVQANNRWAELYRTAYITENTEFRLKTHGNDSASSPNFARVQDVPRKEQTLLLKRGGYLGSDQGSHSGTACHTR